MEEEKIDVKEIEEIIGEPVQRIEKITYGYTNKIYSINGRYILKICINERNRENFKRASLFCQKYHESINCPKVLYSCLDTDNAWQIEEQAKGENLFFKWNQLNKDEKEDDCLFSDSLAVYSSFLCRMLCNSFARACSGSSPKTVCLSKRQLLLL